ncbi:MAG: hypothetical protein H0X25_01655 [Acidobacteriales bacterium]|nr:hypothetical protein [Terriglobales bacterium]
MTLSVIWLRDIDHLRTAAAGEDVLYISSPAVLKKLSLGYDGLLADIYWTRAVQYFGSKHHEGSSNYKLLAPLLEITTTLDPHLLPAYEYGASFLAPAPPYGAGMPDKAVALEEYGIRNNPCEWRLYYQLGFIYATDLKDYGRAARAFQQGSELPNAHPWMKVLAAQMAEHGGDLATARLLWTTTYESTQDRNIRENAAAHLRALQVDEEVGQLEQAAATFRTKTGHWPQSFAELQEAGVLRGRPVDPLGHPYRLQSDGKVLLEDPENFPFVMRGLAEGYHPSMAKFPSHS